MSQFLFFLSISLLLLGILYPPVTQFVGEVLDRILYPVIGFGGKEPALTIFLAGGLMVIITTALRHFFVDWLETARVQDVMKVYNGELREATKANNTFKVKRLTDMQPEILKLQGDMSSSQMKPMLLTMVVIIPAFTWLLTFVTAPVPNMVTMSADADPVALIAVDKDLLTFQALSAGESAEIKPWQGTSVTAVPIVSDRSKVNVTGEASVAKGSEVLGRLPINATKRPFAPDAGLVVAQNLTAGDYVVRLGANSLYMQHVNGGERIEGRYVNHVGLLVFGADPARPKAVKIQPGTETKVSIHENDTAYIVVPALEGEELAGEGVVVFTLPGREVTIPVGAGNVFHLTTATDILELHPHAIRLPWALEWDLLSAWWILPHWILFYSLVSVSVGTITQKALRLIEYAVMSKREVGG